MKREPRNVKLFLVVISFAISSAFFVCETLADQNKSAENLIQRGNELVNKGDFDSAIKYYDEAIKEDPNNARAYFMLGYTFGQIKDYDRAIDYFSISIKIDPYQAITYVGRGISWSLKGNYGKAIDDFGKSIEINPNIYKAYNEKAWILATCIDDKYRDGNQAIELAQKALDLNYIGSNLDTLAAAYAEAGKFKDAIKTQEKAINLLIESNNKKNIAGAKKRLEAYKNQKPWRDN